MIKGILIKGSICLAASFMLSSNVKAYTVDTNNSIAGLTYNIEQYYATTYKENIDTKDNAKEAKVLSVTEVKSPYENLGISIAENYVRIRKEPNTESEIAGKLYKGTVADIIAWEDDWVKIVSGDVEGYIKAEFLAIGADAEAIIEDYATKLATVNTTTLNVRTKKSTDSTILLQIPIGETYIVAEEFDHWVRIVIDDVEGYVNKEFVDISLEFEYAISIEEEQRRIEAEQAAIRAEEERLAALAREEANRQNAASNNSSSNSSSSSSSGSSSSSNSSSSSSNNNTSSSSNNNTSSSSSNSSKGSDIANYGLKFVGNPYVYGGTSLTNGADCSGFVQSIYAQFGYRIPRDSRSQSASAGRQVSLSSLQPGDLIFYRSNGTVNHVALYIGNGKVVHASNPRDGIKVSSYNYRDPYIARRVIQ